MKWCEVHQEQTEAKCLECDHPCSTQWSLSPSGSFDMECIEAKHYSMAIDKIDSIGD